MRNYPALLAVTLAAVASGCSSAVTLPPVAPEEVEIFLPGSFPTSEYKSMTAFMIKGELADADQTLIDRARERAAKLGADGVIITAIRRTSEGGVELNLDQKQEKILEALPIYYPSRHPEVEK